MLAHTLKHIRPMVRSVQTMIASKHEHDLKTPEYLEDSSNKPPIDALYHTSKSPYQSYVDLAGSTSLHIHTTHREHLHNASCSLKTRYENWIAIHHLFKNQSNLADFIAKSRMFHRFTQECQLVTTKEGIYIQKHILDFEKLFMIHSVDIMDQMEKIKDRVQ